MQCLQRLNNKWKRILNILCKLWSILKQTYQATMEDYSILIIHPWTWANNSIWFAFFILVFFFSIIINIRSRQIIQLTFRYVFLIIIIFFLNIVSKKYSTIMKGKRKFSRVSQELFTIFAIAVVSIHNAPFIFFFFFFNINIFTFCSSFINFFLQIHM